MTAEPVLDVIPAPPEALRSRVAGQQPYARHRSLGRQRGGGRGLDSQHQAIGTLRSCSTDLFWATAPKKTRLQALLIISYWLT